MPAILEVLAAEPEGAPPDVEVLADVLDMRGDRVVRVTTLRVVSAAPGSAAGPSPVREPGERPAGIAALIGATSWERIRITVVDGHTVRIGCGGTAIRRTYRDLGLHAENSREPTRKWRLLLAICAAHGRYRGTRAERRAESQAIYVLRGKLKAAFGLAEDPFGAWDDGWRAKFWASSELGGE
jgi:hypothetical protein